MAAAIWSTPAAKIGTYPAASFIRFCDTHGLLKLTGRRVWRTVAGGSRCYVRVLADTISEVASNHPVKAIVRTGHGPSNEMEHHLLPTGCWERVRRRPQPPSISARQ